jgi:LmbE family N-acetylglucosaminyl deacetylase
MRILAVSAHPDDVEYGCGGFLIDKRFGTDPPAQLVVIVYTLPREELPLINREQQELKRERLRYEESQKALGALLVENSYYFGFPDTDAPMNAQVIALLERTIKKEEPDIVLLPYSQDTHQDHQVVANVGLAASRYSPTVLMYESLTSIEFQPTVFADITKWIDQKDVLLAHHSSQVNKTNIEGANYITLARGTATYRGIQARVKYAEGFVPVRYVL